MKNDKGGVFRSDDGGKTWTQTNSDRSLRQRAWYYSRIYADTKDVNKVYVMNVAYHTSTDGGKTFKARYAPHGDHHDLWIAPEDPNRMIIGDDGGGQVTYDGGANWSSYENQPTAQFYRVTTDDHFPVPHFTAHSKTIPPSASKAARTAGSSPMSIGNPPPAARVPTSPPDPTDNDIVYGGSYGGFLSRKNHHTNMTRAIHVWPDNPLGAGAEAMKYRFQWNFPVFFSPHDATTLYTCSQFLHRSRNGGESWEVISPDLTRKRPPKKLVSSGGPITQDNTGVEYYATIFAAEESPYEPGLLWCGSDDGLLHVSRNGGDSWDNVTPKKLPEWAQINSIEVDPHHKGGLYVAATMYRLGDYTPYLYHTNDYGKSWKLITGGLPTDHFTRVIRADREVDGLLYCGTEFGLYVSTNGGVQWQPLQLNLPPVPVTDLALKDNDLIVATQGRSFWILDDLNVIWDEVKSSTKAEELRLYSVHPTVGYGAGSGATSPPRAPITLLAYACISTSPRIRKTYNSACFPATGRSSAPSPPRPKTRPISSRSSPGSTPLTGTSATPKPTNSTGC